MHDLALVLMTAVNKGEGQEHAAHRVSGRSSLDEYVRASSPLGSQIPRSEAGSRDEFKDTGIARVRWRQDTPPASGGDDQGREERDARGGRRRRCRERKRVSGHAGRAEEQACQGGESDDTEQDRRRISDVLWEAAVLKLADVKLVLDDNREAKQEKLRELAALMESWRAAQVMDDDAHYDHVG